MPSIIRPPRALSERETIQESAYAGRRDFLRALGTGTIAGVALAKLGCVRANKLAAPAETATAGLDCTEKHAFASQGASEQVVHTKIPKCSSQDGHNETMLLFDTLLIFDRPQESHKAAPLPLVTAKIGGHSTLLIVDTGTTETILTRSLVKSLGIRSQLAEPGTDHAGGRVTTWTTEESTDLDIESYTLPLERAAVVDAPARFQELGIGGVLCPQRLHDNAAVVFDFCNDRLQLVSGPMDRALSMVTTPADLRSLQFDMERLSGEDASLIVVNGTLQPAIPVRLMLNTGSYEAEFAPRLLPYTAVDHQILGRGISGTPVRGAVLRGRELLLRDVRISMPEVIVRSQRGQIDGQLGMQILRGTHLAIHLREGSVHWSIPTHRLSH